MGAPVDHMGDHVIMGMKTGAPLVGAPIDHMGDHVIMGRSPGYDHMGDHKGRPLGSTTRVDPILFHILQRIRFGDGFIPADGLETWEA